MTKNKRSTFEERVWEDADMTILPPVDDAAVEGSEEISKELSDKVGQAIEEIYDNDWTEEVWQKWGRFKEVQQADLSDEDFTELRELFDIELFDTDGETYKRTELGDEVWEVLQ